MSNSVDLWIPVARGWSVALSRERDGPIRLGTSDENLLGLKSRKKAPNADLHPLAAGRISYSQMDDLHPSVTACLCFLVIVLKCPHNVCHCYRPFSLARAHCSLEIVDCEISHIVAMFHKL